MSKGIPIAQRPDLKNASLSARLDAVFGSLGPAPAAGGWALRQDVQPFKAGGGIEDYNYSSDEEDPNEGLKPLMPSRLVDSDDDDGSGADGVPPLERANPDADFEDAGLSQEQGEARAARERERLRASLSSRRAFEAEAEEDEYDRVATGTMNLRTGLADAKPPGCTEVPQDSAWERMHSRWQQQRQRPEQQGDEGRQQQQPDVVIQDALADGRDSTAAGQTATLGSADSGDSSPAVASQKRFRSDSTSASAPPPQPQQQVVQPAQALAGGDVAAGDVEMLGAGATTGEVNADTPGDPAAVRGGGFAGLRSDSVRAGGGSDSGGAAAIAVRESSMAVAAHPPRQRGGRRVQWADFAVASGRSSEAAADGGPRGGATEGAAGRREVSGGDGEVGVNGRGPRPAASGDGGRGGGGAGSRVRLDWQRRGFVPDHVCNPHKYRRYTLDEELVVGGGEYSANGRNGRNGGGEHGGGGLRHSGGAREGDDGEMQQALAQARRAVEAAARADHDPERAETTFGSGITFRPRTARHHGEAGPEKDTLQRGGAESRGPAAADLGPMGRLHGAYVAEDDGDGAEEGVQSGGGSAGVGEQGAAGRSWGRRHFRGRVREEADEEAAGGGGGAVNGDAMQQE